jgi:benzoyl-CoA 2,3-dioxygenase component B
MFTYFTDRDGKYQIGTLKESGFDPLSRTCEFMLKEEAHHMMVGTTGVDRVVTRTAELMKQHDTADIARFGGVPLDVIQKYINFHYSVSLDLFGSDTSTNVANYYTAGIKGRWQEDRRKDDHQLIESIASIPLLDGDLLIERDLPALTALNVDLRNEYSADCANGVKRWNSILEEFGIDRTVTLPSVGFNRQVGTFSAKRITPEGKIVDQATWDATVDNYLPSADDKAHIASLMQPVYEPGKIAGWVAPPKTGINGQPFEYEYVHLA